MKLFIAVLVVITVASAVPKVNQNAFTQVEPDPRLVKGRVATPHSLPYQVLLNAGSYFSGALISRNYVLTAATFVKGKSSVDIILGAHNITDNEDSQVKMTSTEILVHPRYDDFLHYNLAIIRLPLSVRLTPTIRPIDLPKKDVSNDYTGALATASNWRMTTSDGVDYISDVLNDMQVNVISNTECSQFYNDITSDLLCASGDSTTCRGDTGAPLVTGGVLIGVAAFLSPNCPNALPSGFTRITALLPWILENTDA